MQNCTNILFPNENIDLDLTIAETVLVFTPSILSTMAWLICCCRVRASFTETQRKIGQVWALVGVLAIGILVYRGFDILECEQTLENINVWTSMSIVSIFISACIIIFGIAPRLPLLCSGLMIDLAFASAILDVLGRNILESQSVYILIPLQQILAGISATFVMHRQMTAKTQVFSKTLSVSYTL